MKNKFIIILLLVLAACLSISNVAAEDNLDNVTDLGQSGEVVVDTTQNNTAVLDSNGSDSDLEDSIDANIITGDLVKYYKNDSQFIIKLVDGQGNPLVGEKLNITINGMDYTRTTNSTGNAKFNVNLDTGSYVITTSYKSLSVNNTITVLSVIDAQDLVKYFRNESQFIFRSLDKQGNTLAGQRVTLNINGIIYNRTTNASGLAKVNINLNPADYIITLYYGDFAISKKIKILSYIVGEDLVKYHRNESQYIVKILDKSGNPVSGEKITLNINGVFYYRTTNASGLAKLNINLNPGEYIITTYLNDLAFSNNITIYSRFVEVTGDVKTTYGKWAPFKIKVLDNVGANLVNGSVDFDVGGVKYSNTTDDEGIATFNVGLNAGIYGISYSIADGIGGSNLYTVKNQISYAVMKWNDGGDVTDNEIIEKNLPNSTLIDKLVELSKDGTPLVQIKGGDGKTVFMSSGVHGNELSSQVAMLRMINNLETTPINGTVYIAPFVCPQNTALNVRRYNGEDLNRVANVKGTPSYNLVQLISQFKCDAYGDFHTTQSPGIPGRNVIMGVPTYSTESGKMARAISQITGFGLDNELLTGSEYYGSLAAQTCIKGIPGIISEIISVPGSMDAGSDEKSYTQIEGFLKYNGII